MREAAYAALDERTGHDRTLTPFVFVLLNENDPEWVEVNNFVGSRGELVLYDPTHPDFVDDEEDGLVVLPTPMGKITLMPITEELYENARVMHEDNILAWPEWSEGADVVQKFLRYLCCATSD